MRLSVETALRAGLIASLVLPAFGCASLPITLLGIKQDPVVTVPASELSIDEDDTELMANLRHDWSRFVARDEERKSVIGIPAPMQQASAPAAPGSIFGPLRFTSQRAVLSSLIMPIVGLGPQDLDDNYGQSRDGGRRTHRGIDIFATRGAEIVAVTDGYISYIGEQSKGGRCLWLVTEAGLSFYYAHLDRWAPGIYEGLSVHTGDLLGYVGNTGNAAHTASHLHFQVVENDEAVNPYPLLAHSIRASHPHPVLAGGFSRGTQ